MQNDTSDELYIKRNHVPFHFSTSSFPFFANESAAGIFNNGEGFWVALDRLEQWF